MITKFSQLLAILLLLNLTSVAQECGVWYVTPAGSGAGTTQSPASLQQALNNLSVNDNTIRLLEGTYTINGSITVPLDDVVFDGGYTNSGGTWVKSSSATTTLNINPTLETPSISGITVGVYRGIIADGKSNFGFFDLTINVLTAGATGTTSNRGRSVYGAHISNSSNYHFTRCVINTGAASNGASGTATQPAAANGVNAPGKAGGAGGAPGGGTGGAGGNGRSGCSSASAQHHGAAGGLGDLITAGGAGGAAGTQSSQTCCTEKNGSPGGAGFNGVAGNSWAVGDRPTVNAPTGMYFVPGGQADAGGNGLAGGGGGGGGGGKGGTSGIFCSSDGGGDGGGGGGGGSGGLGGDGGYGAGSAFAFFAFGSGMGTIEDCVLNPGNAGTGGVGGNGGAGGTGGNGAPGFSGSGANGAPGGKGGIGGAGGRGRDGANGFSNETQTAGGASLNKTGSTVPNPATVAVNYFNYTGCTNSLIEINKISGTWSATTTGRFVNDITATTSTYNSGSNTAVVAFTAEGFYDLGIVGGTYIDMFKVTDTRPLPVITPVSDVCSGQQVNLSTPTTGTGYSWEVALASSPQTPVLTFNVQNPGDINLTADGDYQIKLSVFDDCCGWSVPVYETFTVSAAPAVTFQPVNAFCEEDASLDLTSYGSPVGGNFSGPGIISNHIFNPTIAGPGQHIIEYEYAASGCPLVATQTIVVNAQPVAGFTGLNGPYCIDDTAAVVLNGTPSGGTFSGTGVSGSTFVPSQAAIGNNQVTYEVSDANGCSSSTTQTVQVSGLPLISFSGLDNFYCEDFSSQVTLTGNPAGGTFSGPGVSTNNFNPSAAGAGIHEISYTFTDPNGCTNDFTKLTVIYELPQVTIKDLAAGYCEVTTTVPLNGFPAGGTFTVDGVTATSIDISQYTPGSTIQVNYDYTDSKGCSNSDSQQVEVYEQPTAVLTLPGTAYCETEAAVILNGTPGGGIFIGPGVTDFDDSFHPSVAGPGTHEISYLYLDSNNCQDIQSGSIEVSAADAVIESFTVTDATCGKNNGSIELEITSNGQPYTVSWSHDESLTLETASEISAGLYTVEVTDDQGCASTETIEVRCEDTGSTGSAAFVPNAFSPNNDTRNDFLYVIGDNIQRLEFRVFNRWGAQIFETSNQNVGWDGKFNGREVPIGAYVYSLTVTYEDNRTDAINGTVTLVR